jgi:hypothetical protein
MIRLGRSGRDEYEGQREREPREGPANGSGSHSAVIGKQSAVLQPHRPRPRLHRRGQDRRADAAADARAGAGRRRPRLPERVPLGPRDQRLPDRGRWAAGARRQAQRLVGVEPRRAEHRARLGERRPRGAGSRSLARIPRGRSPRPPASGCERLSPLDRVEPHLPALDSRRERSAPARSARRPLRRPPLPRRAAPDPAPWHDPVRDARSLHPADLAARPDRRAGRLRGRAPGRPAAARLRPGRLARPPHRARVPQVRRIPGLEVRRPRRPLGAT